MNLNVLNFKFFKIKAVKGCNCTLLSTYLVAASLLPLTLPSASSPISSDALVARLHSHIHPVLVEVWGLDPHNKFQVTDAPHTCSLLHFTAKKPLCKQGVRGATTGKNVHNFVAVTSISLCRSSIMIVFAQGLSCGTYSWWNEVTSCWLSNGGGDWRDKIKLKHGFSCQ